MMFKTMLLSLAVIGLVSCSSSPSTTLDTSEEVIGVTQFEVTYKGGWYQVFAWYPAEDKGTQPALPYAEKWLNKALAKQYGIPSFLAGGVSLSESWQEAPVKAGKFPVIIFNHGWQAFARSNMTQMETLAKNGYVVLSINHPGDSVMIQRTDGSFVSQTEAVKKSVKANKQQLNAIAEHFENLKSASSGEAYHTEIGLLQNQPLYQPIEQNFHHWVEQTQHLVSLVRQENAPALPTELTPHMDSNKLGLMGHSFGGAVSGLVALQDPDKIPAVVLDAPQFDFGLPIYNTQASILYLTGTDLKFGKTKVSNENLNQALVKHYPNIQERNFVGASHMNFTDLNHVTPLKWTGVLGPVDNKVFWKSLNDAVLNFYNQQFENEITNAR